METLKYYKVNVPYPVGVRFHSQDATGRVLSERDPYIAVTEVGLRDFKRANKYAIINGLIIETTEPSFDWESPNMIDDEKAAELVKNVFVLKKALAEITSPSVVRKILEEAKTQNRPAKTIKLIEAKLEEIDDVVDDVFQMRGVE